MAHVRPIVSLAWLFAGLLTGCASSDGSAQDLVAKEQAQESSLPPETTAPRGRETASTGETQTGSPLEDKTDVPNDDASIQWGDLPSEATDVQLGYYLIGDPPCLNSIETDFPILEMDRGYAPDEGWLGEVMAFCFGGAGLDPDTAIEVVATDPEGVQHELETFTSTSNGAWFYPAFLPVGFYRIQSFQYGEQMTDDDVYFGPSLIPNLVAIDQTGRALLYEDGVRLSAGDTFTYDVHGRPGMSVEISVVFFPANSDVDTVGSLVDQFAIKLPAPSGSSRELLDVPPTARAGLYCLATFNANQNQELCLARFLVEE